MNKFLVLTILATMGCFAASAKDCNLPPSGAIRDNDFTDMKDLCTRATEEQINKEITASLKYLSFAAYFTKDSVNRPGFAKFFFDAAGEERAHAYALIQYLQMRGRYPGEIKSAVDVKKLVKDSGNPTTFLNLILDDISSPSAPRNPNFATSSGLAALQNALKMEKAVTSSIRKLIKTCEEGDNFNHYHFVDHLTGEFLEEQYKGQRDLAGKISTLSKMLKDNSAELADFLFDKQLL